jgi:hypothetical protein
MEESNCLGESDQEGKVKGESIPIYRKVGVGQFLLESLSFSAGPNCRVKNSPFYVTYSLKKKFIRVKSSF